ncbi:MAG: molybdopterin-dependent oxidoreductase [Acidimicrobiia bacterium]|nr:molybdopterin-dependent oxidoreductase [Acidimicrobiia bacterium]
MTGAGTRTGEDAYRHRWSWDGVGWGTHCVDCYPGNCPHRVFVRDGKVWREEPSGTFGAVEPGVPDMNPMGCNKGTVWSRQLTNPDRVTHPLRRVGERGEGRWEQISWDEAYAVLADAILDAVEASGPESVVHEGTPEMTTVVPTHRFMGILGGTVTDFNATTNDFNVGLHITYGKFSPVSSIDDWFHSELVLIWHMNPSFTRIPHAHFVFEARYHGAEVVLFAPDYNASAMHTDRFVPVEPGSDAALALAMSQVIVTEGLVDEGFVRTQTDLPLLVRTDTGRFLREADLVDGGRDDRFHVWVDGGPRPAPRGTLAHDAPPALDGRWTVTLADGAPVEVTTVFTLLRGHLDAHHTPEQASRSCGVHPDVVRDLARQVASRRTNILFGAAASKYFHGDLIERSLCLLLALTGNWGKKGTGIRSWSAGMFDGPALAMAKPSPGIEGTEAVVGALEGLVEMARAADPTLTRELASGRFSRFTSGMVPPFFFWYHHVGYRERWSRRDWGDPTMPREFDEYVQEALDAGWWDGLVKLPPERPPRVLIECGGNMVRRTRGGRNTVLRNLWPQLALVAVIDTRMSATALHADLVLPAAHHYEKLDFHIPTPHVMNLVFSDRVQAPEGESLTEWQLFAGLCRALADRAAARGLESYTDASGVVRRYEDLWSAYTLDGHYEDEERRTDEMLRDSVYTGTLPEGTDLPAMRKQGHVRFSGWGILPYGQAQASPFPEGETHTPFRNHVEEMHPYPTLTRRAQFYIDHPWFLEAGEALPTHKDAPDMGGPHPFRLTSGHCRWSVHRMNIAQHDLLQTHRGEPHVAINDRVAAERGIADHDPVEVRNGAGSFVVRAKLSPSVRPNQVIVYNGWEAFQFPGWQGPNDVEPGMVKWLHLAAGYGHLDYSPTAWQPATVDRGTRVDVRPAPEGAT